MERTSTCQRAGCPPGLQLVRPAPSSAADKPWSPHLPGDLPALPGPGEGSLPWIRDAVQLGSSGNRMRLQLLEFLCRADMPAPKEQGHKSLNVRAFSSATPQLSRLPPSRGSGGVGYGNASSGDEGCL